MPLIATMTRTKTRTRPIARPPTYHMSVTVAAAAAAGLVHHGWCHRPTSALGFDHVRGVGGPDTRWMRLVRGSPAWCAASACCPAVHAPRESRAWGRRPGQLGRDPTTVPVAGGLSTSHGRCGSPRRATGPRESSLARWRRRRHRPPRRTCPCRRTHRARATAASRSWRSRRARDRRGSRPGGPWDPAQPSAAGHATALPRVGGPPVGGRDDARGTSRARPRAAEGHDAFQFKARRAATQGESAEPGLERSPVYARCRRPSAQDESPSTARGHDVVGRQGAGVVVDPSLDPGGPRLGPRDVLDAEQRLDKQGKVAPQRGRGVAQRRRGVKGQEGSVRAEPVALLVVQPPVEGRIGADPGAGGRPDPPDGEPAGPP